MRREILTAISWVGTPRALHHLTGRLFDPDPAVRALVVEELTRVPEAGRLMLALLNDPSSAVRLKLAETFGRRKGPEAGEALLKLVQDEDAAVRRAALSSTVEIGGTEEIAELLSGSPLPRDNDDFVAVLKIVGPRIGGEKTKEILDRIPSLKGEGAGIAAVTVARRAGKKEIPLLRELFGRIDREGKGVILSRLAEIRNEAAVEIIKDSLRSGDEAIVASAVTALGKASGRGGIRAIIDIGLGASSRLVRDAAVRTIQSLSVNDTNALDEIRSYLRGSIPVIIRRIKALRRKTRTKDDSSAVLYIIQAAGGGVDPRELSEMITRRITDAEKWRRLTMRIDAGAESTGLRIREMMEGLSSSIRSDIVDLLRTFADSMDDWPGTVRRLILLTEILAGADPPEEAGDLMHAPNEELRRVAFDCHLYTNERRKTAALKVALADPSSTIRRAAGAAIASLSEEKRQDLIRLAMDDEKIEIRMAALSALPSSWELFHSVLSTAASDPDPRMRARAAEVLAASGRAEDLDRALGIIEALIPDGDPAVSATALDSAGALLEAGGRAGAIPGYVESYTESHHSPVIVAAVKALYRADHEAAERKVDSLLNDEEKDRWRAGLLLIGALGLIARAAVIAEGLLTEDRGVRSASLQALDLAVGKTRFLDAVADILFARDEALAGG